MNKCSEIKYTWLLWSQSKTNLPETIFTYRKLGTHQNCHHNHCRNHKPIWEECIVLHFCTGNYLIDHTLWQLKIKEYTQLQQTATPMIFCLLQSNIFNAVTLFQTNHMVHWNVLCEDIFSVWHCDFFGLRDVHSQHIYLKEERKAWLLFISWR